MHSDPIAKKGVAVKFSNAGLSAAIAALKVNYFGSVPENTSKRTIAISVKAENKPPG